MPSYIKKMLNKKNKKIQLNMEEIKKNYKSNTSNTLNKYWMMKIRESKYALDEYATNSKLSLIQKFLKRL